MNHNKYNLERGETVILDEDFTNDADVIIVDFTPNSLFATVRDFGNTDTWSVMTNRLTPKYKYIKNEDGTITGIRMCDIKHQNAGYTFVTGRKNSYQWIVTEDLHDTEWQAKEANTVQYLK